MLQGHHSFTICCRRTGLALPRGQGWLLSATSSSEDEDEDDGDKDDDDKDDDDNEAYDDDEEEEEDSSIRLRFRAIAPIHHQRTNNIIC